MKHSTKKLLSLVLTLVMGMMTLCNTIVARAGQVNINGQKASEGAANASSFTGEGYEIKYYVDNYNTGEYQEQIWITNTGDKTIENWKLKFNLPYNIDAICNGTWETYENEYQSCSDGTYLIPNQGWDANIEAGGCVQLSFKFKSDNGVVDPTEFQLLHSGMLNIEGEGYTIDHNIINYEANGYQDNITIINTSDKVIHNWSLKFNSPYSIYAIYNGEWQTYENGYARCKDGSYIITNHVDNADIEPGSCVKVSCTFRTEEVVTEPTDSRLIQKEKIYTQGNGYSIEYDVNNYRKDEYQTFITVTNTGDEAIKNWSLKFDCPYKIDSVYNGAWENYDNGYAKCEDGSYLITNQGCNANIDIGQSIKVSYIFKTQDEVVDPTYLMFLYENSLNDGDYDGLTDYQEVYIHGTNPKDPDTDKDGLNDGAEIKLGFNPLVSDSNNDGVLDGKEKTNQNLACDIEEQDCAINNVSIQINGTGLVSETTEIKNTMGIDMLSSEVVGLVGVPVNIETKSEFDRATITFAYDESKLGDVNEDDLRIMWYDEENNNYVILDDETVLDKENNTLSYTTTHFSTYLVVDKEDWYDCWRTTINYRTDDSQETQESQNFDVCFVVDRSGSMSGNSIITAKDSMIGFNEAMHYDDRVAIVGFDSTARVHLPFLCPRDEAVKNSIGNITASGGTNVESGLVSALDLFDKTEPQMNDKGVKNAKMMILLCDGDVYYTEATLKRAKDSGIRIYTVLIGSSSGRTALEHIAEVTQGKFYSAQDAVDIRDAIYGIKDETVSKIDTTDTDSDGLYDIYETAGMRISNGTVMYSFVSIADSDNDGLMDGEEITPRHDLNNMPIWREIAIKSKLGEMVVKHIYFDYKSDPKKNDTDGDGDSDVFDPNPVVYLLNGYFSKQISALEKLANKYYTGSDWLMKYTVGKAKWYVFMFIRQFNSLYNNGTWSSVGGEIDKDFIEYVKNRDIALYNYFNNIESIYANTLLEKVDLRHLAATATVCIYNTDLIDAQYYEYKDYDSWYKLWTNAKIFVDNGKNIVQTEMREYHFNNLAGWAGDLQTLMNDVQLTDVQLNGGISVNSYDGFYKKFSSMLCDDIYSFSQQDMYADIDAYNIVGLIEAKSIGEACLLYYDNGYKKRVTKFTNNWSKNRISDLVSIYTKTKYLGIERWPLFECDFTEEQSKAARDSFVDYLLNRRNEE